MQTLKILAIVIGGSMFWATMLYLPGIIREVSAVMQ